MFCFCMSNLSWAVGTSSLMRFGGPCNKSFWESKIGVLLWEFWNLTSGNQHFVYKLRIKIPVLIIIGDPITTFFQPHFFFFKPQHTLAVAFRVGFTSQPPLLEKQIPVSSLALFFGRICQPCWNLHRAFDGHF